MPGHGFVAVPGISSTPRLWAGRAWKLSTHLDVSHGRTRTRTTNEVGSDPVIWSNRCWDSVEMRSPAAIGCVVVEVAIMENFRVKSWHRLVSIWCSPPLKGPWLFTVTTLYLGTFHFLLSLRVNNLYSFFHISLLIFISVNSTNISYSQPITIESLTKREHRD